MELCFSFGRFDIKYFFFCVLSLILEICINLFIYNDDDNNNIITKHILLDPFCYYVGFLFNIFLVLISNKFSKSKSETISKTLKEENTHIIEYVYNNPYDKYLSTKDIIKFFGICIILLITDIIEIIINIKNSIKNDYVEDEIKEFQYEEDYLFYEFLVIYFLPLFFTDITYYKHQKITFIILCLLEFTKSSFFTFFFYEFSAADIWVFLLNILSAILYSTFFVYIKGLMKYKFISPYKCCYMIGVINVPLIIIIYFILSFFNLGDCKSVNDNNSYCVNIFELFQSGLFNATNIFRLICFILMYMILMAMLVKIVNDYTIYYIYTPFLLENFVKNIIKMTEESFDISITIFLSISFFIELIMILIFLEIIEVKFCGLNKDLKKNIELRAIDDSSYYLNDNNDNNDDNEDDERYSY